MREAGNTRLFMPLLRRDSLQRSLRCRFWIVQKLRRQDKKINIIIKTAQNKLGIALGWRNGKPTKDADFICIGLHTR